MNEYVLRLPENSNIVLSTSAVQRLIATGDGDAALLYLAVLRDNGHINEKKSLMEMKWPLERFRRALDNLSAQGLVAVPDDAHTPPLPETPQEEKERLPEYTRADMSRALEGQDFAALTAAVEDKLGKKCTTPDLAILLGLYDQLGLPSDVIYLLVSFCCERASQRHKGRKPTMRQIEREGYTWSRLGLMDQESAAAYIKKYHQQQEALPRMMRLLGLEDRKPSTTEEKYLLSWIDMGFEDEAVERAYDKTVIQCKELRWPYMNKILVSWHKAGLHTLSEIEAGDKPRQSTQTQYAKPEAAQDDMARLARYREQLRREMEGS